MIRLLPTRLVASALAIMSATAAMACLAAATVLGPAAFTDEVAIALRSRLVGARVSVSKPLELEAAREEGVVWTLRVGNLYDSYRSHPEKLSRIVTSYAEAIARSPHMRLAPAVEAVLPVLRTQAWLDEMRASEHSKRTPPLDQSTALVEPYGKGLVIAYVLDRAPEATVLTPRDLRSLGIERHSLFRTATANLARHDKQIHLQPMPQVTLVTAGGRFDSALLLHDSLWRDGRIKVDGEPVVLASDQGLLVTGSRNSAGLARLMGTMSLAKTPADRAAQPLLILTSGRFSPLPSPQ